MKTGEEIFFTREKEFLNECAESEKIPGGAFAVITPEKTNRFYFGCKSLLPERMPMEEGAMFDLASLTKVVSTTTVALQCLERGYYSLQTEVKELLPEFPYSHITVESLLTHTSGVCSDDKAYKKCAGKREMTEFLFGRPLEFRAGTKVKYSDFGYVLLGLVLERMVGDLETYAEEHIFWPLKMKDTCYNPQKKGMASRCVPTEQTGDRGIICGEVHDGKAWRMGGVSGNAGLFSTVEDLERFVRMLLNGGQLDGERILSTATMRLLHRCYTEGLDQRRTLGWIVDDKAAQMGDYYSSHCLFHTGFTGTSIYVDFDRKCGVILLTNRIHPSRDNTAIFEIRRRVHNLVLLNIDNNRNEEEKEIWL